VRPLIRAAGAIAPILVPMLAVAACGVTAPAGDEARFTGDVTPFGVVTPGGGCGAASRGTLTLLAGKIAFTPTDGVITLRGKLSADGTIRGELTTTGADHKPYVMSLDARREGAHVTGIYSTPACHFAVSLTQVHYSLF
jgi:hypothetical protein